LHLQERQVGVFLAGIFCCPQFEFLLFYGVKATHQPEIGTENGG
jgi:hypothetical protein